jgi:hypothetical protein
VAWYFVFKAAEQLNEKIRLVPMPNWGSWLEKIYSVWINVIQKIVTINKITFI